MLKDVVVPAAVLGIIASLLIPLPAVVLDFLLVINIVLALVLLASTLYIPEPLRLSSLPSLLLLTTLYRLALNISTTRLILGSGAVGQVIEAFGAVVVQGNVLVGLVVFLIITLIQFIVIAKGAERVAEVSARFTLDALPGKQMSIDADVRGGLIDFEEASGKRRHLQIESRFYGALDGAMKFIKGDAIAGIVITLVNIIGGLAIGVGMHGLDFGVAVQRYTLLTVGDGLLSQIPALLNALAAGMVVTRVERGDGVSLASELLSQLGQLRQVKFLIGGAAVVLSFVAGMPWLPFFSLGILLIIAAIMSPQIDQLDASKPTAGSFTPRIPPVLEVKLSMIMAEQISLGARLDHEVEQFRQQVYGATGLILQAPNFGLNAEGSEDYTVFMRGVPIMTRRTEGDLTTIFKDLHRVVADHAPELVDDILTRRTLDFFDREAPELVAAVVPEIATVTDLTKVLKSLVSEGITVLNFDVILQAVAEQGTRSSPRQMLSAARLALKRVISAKYAPEGNLRCVALSPALDLALAETESAVGGIDPDSVNFIVEQLRDLPEPKPVLVVSSGARGLLKECLELRREYVPVLSYEELESSIKLEVVQTIEPPEGVLQEKIIASLAA